jgi:hypothetical protein
MPSPRRARAPPLVAADATEEDVVFDLAVVVPGS